MRACFQFRMVALEVQGLAHMGGAQSGEEQGPQLPGAAAAIITGP